MPNPNNIDFAEMLIECVKQVLKTYPPDTPVTWGDLLTALQEYIKAEEYNILWARKYKKEGL